MSSDFTAWLAMGGYGAFVWPCYGIALVLLAGIAISSYRSRKDHLRLLEALQKNSDQSPE